MQLKIEIITSSSAVIHIIKFRIEAWKQKPQKNIEERRSWFLCQFLGNVINAVVRSWEFHVVVLDSSLLREEWFIFGFSVCSSPFHCVFLTLQLNKRNNGSHIDSSHIVYLHTSYRCYPVLTVIASSKDGYRISIWIWGRLYPCSHVSFLEWKRIGWAILVCFTFIACYFCHLQWHSCDWPWSCKLKIQNVYITFVCAYFEWI